MSGQWRKVRIQAELQQVVDAGDYAEIVAAGNYWASGSATVRAYGSATVRASGSATVRAYGSATVQAYDSATVQAYDSATVQAYDSATVQAYGSATVEATPYVAVHKRSKRARLTGGVLIEPPNLTDRTNWLGYYGLVPDEHGIVTLYKSVKADYLSPHGADYSPGSTPIATDWQDTNDCGCGLHFSPRPHMALAYHDGDGQRFVACPVRADSIRPIGGEYTSDKVKAQQVEQPGCRECDIDGEPVTQPEQVSA